MTEAELLEKFAKTEDYTYLGEALQRYSLVLYGVALKYLKDESDAQDMVQVVFMKALDKLPTKVDNLGGWLYQVLKNECFSFLAKKKTQYHKALTEDFVRTINEDAPKDQVFYEKVDYEESLVRSTMLELKEEQRKCLDLFFFKKKSYVQIQEITGYELKKVKSYIQNGKRNLKIKLEAQGIEKK